MDWTVVADRKWWTVSGSRKHRGLKGLCWKLDLWDDWMNVECDEKFLVYKTSDYNDSPSNSANTLFTVFDPPPSLVTNTNYQSYQCHIDTYHSSNIGNHSSNPHLSYTFKQKRIQMLVMARVCLWSSAVISRWNQTHSGHCQKIRRIKTFERCASNTVQLQPYLCYTHRIATQTQMIKPN